MAKAILSVMMARRFSVRSARARVVLSRKTTMANEDYAALAVVCVNAFLLNIVIWRDLFRRAGS